MPLCIAAGGLVVALATNTFTLAWMHSIEKVRWEEDYRIEDGRLRLVEARVAGSGAGMDPPSGSRLQNGVWHYAPRLAPLPELRLTHSDFTAGYELCIEARCSPLALHAPAAASGQVIRLTACEAGPPAGAP